VVRRGDDGRKEIPPLVEEEGYALYDWDEDEGIAGVEVVDEDKIAIYINRKKERKKQLTSRKSKEKEDNTYCFTRIR